MKHCMLDLETLGNEPGCVVVSIGATIFDPRGKGHGKTFYAVLDIFSQLMAGLTINTDTVEWWKKLSLEAREALTRNIEPTESVLSEFAEWCIDNKVSRVHCQGASFDAPILAKVYQMMGSLSVPYKFWEYRDTRTVYDIADFDYKTVERKGTFHNALDDAIHQVECVQQALRKTPIVQLLSITPTGIPLPNAAPWPVPAQPKTLGEDHRHLA